MATVVATALGIVQDQKQKDIQHRIDAHQVMMAMAPPTGLNIVATGDSWFDYPLDGDFPGINTDVLAQLKKVMSVEPEILSLAHYGYTSTQELGLQRQAMLVKALTDPANGKFDAILMSGGGNDIAGDALCIWLNDVRVVNGDYGQALNLERFDGALDVITASFHDLIAIRDEFAPGTPILMHSYDYPVVNGKGVCTLGPWLKPAFDYCGWTDELKCGIVLAGMMRLFSGRLDLLASGAQNVVHVRTLGTVAADQWANELHPTPAGFKLIAEKFAAELTKLFP